jgi:hypothetical protein
MFSVLAILAIVSTVAAAPTIATLLLSRASPDDRESRREALAIAVEVEKATTAWRARHQTLDRELWRRLDIRGCAPAPLKVGMAVYTAKALLHGKGGDAWEMMVENLPWSHRMRPRAQDRCFTRRVTMFDAQIVLALFAAFLLGIVVGSGMEIIVRSGRY